MDDLLECTKCGSEVDQILALSCEHNLCLPCSAKLFAKSQSNELTCQICATITALDPSAVEVLAQMYNLNQSRSSMRSSHKMNPLLSNLQQSRTNHNQVTCQQHPSEEAILYCFTCETPCFCMECYLSGLHKSHDVKNVQKSYHILRTTKAEQIYQKVKTSSEQLLAEQCKYANKKRELMDLSAQSKLQIQQNFSELYKALQLKEAELIQHADECINEKLRLLEQENLKILGTIEKLNDINRDIERYFPEQPDQSASIQAFNYVALNSRKIENMARQILAERETLIEAFQLNYILDPQSLIQQVEDIRSAKIKISTMKGIEASEPTIQEKQIYERVREERAKRLFQLPLQQEYENKENSISCNLSDFERKFHEAKKSLTNRQRNI